MGLNRRSGRRWQLRVAGAVVLALLLAVVAGRLAAAQPAPDGAWSEPVQISYLNQYAWYADLAADPAGNLHAVYASFNTEFNTVMYTLSADGGLNWSQPNDIQAIARVGRSSEATRPALLMQSNGLLGLTFSSDRVYVSQAPALRAADASTWSAPNAVSTYNYHYAANMAEDALGRLHIVYSENQPEPDCPICFHLFYRWSDNGGRSWSAVQDLSADYNGVAKPRLLVDQQNNLHVIFEVGLGGMDGQLQENAPAHLAIVSSYDRGERWSVPLKLSGDTQQARSAAIGMDGSGRILVAWQSPADSRIYTTVSSDQGRDWPVAQALPGAWGSWASHNTRSDSYSMATDSAGNVHLVLVGKTTLDTTSLSLLHFTWRRGAWSEPEIIRTFVGDVPDWPRIAVSLGNRLNVTYTLRDAAHIWDVENGKYRVFFTRAQASGAPGIQPEPVTDAALALTATANHPTPVVDAPVETTASPAATLAVTPGAREHGEFTPLDYLLIVLGSLAPAVLILALVIVVIKARR